MTPVHAFVHKSFIWVVYPRHSGGPLIEVLGSHYPNGIPSEPMVAAILYDAAQGLVNLHQQMQCHRSISAQSLHVDVGKGLTLLSNFGELKEIKWKHKQGRRDTMIAPQRHPFTDPLILFGDDRANWYLGDVYSLGITALQLCYGSTPTLATKHNLQGTPISTELYDADRKCPFGSAFKAFVKDCCAKVEQRTSAKHLLQHKFLRLRADAEQVTTFFKHILKSTEQRINGALQRPQWFPMRADEQDALSNENVDESNHVLTITPAQAQGHTQHAQQAPTDANALGAEEQKQARPDLHDEQWSFSTTFRSKSDLDVQAKAQEQAEQEQLQARAQTELLTHIEQPAPQPQAQSEPLLGQTPVVEEEKALAHDELSPQAVSEAVNGKSQRKYRISFSESQSDARAALGLGGAETPAAANTVPPVQVGRFGVSYPSRMSHSEPSQSGQPVEPSETEPYDPESGSQHSHSSQHLQLEEPDKAQGQGQTRQIRRFIISNADVSADEDPE